MKVCQAVCMSPVLSAIPPGPCTASCHFVLCCL